MVRVSDSLKRAYESLDNGEVGTLLARDHLVRRRCPLTATAVFIVAGMAYTFWWGPVVQHAPQWIVPGDIWSTFRAAHWVGWGDLGGVYGGDSQLVAFPGIAVLLAPVAMVSNALGMSESIAPVFLAHPTSWYLLGPATMVLGCLPLFAVDAMAEEVGAERTWRAALCWAEAVVIFQVVAIWGHPEDLVALAAALYGLVAMFRRRWTLSAWLWGAAIVVQPLVVLMFPLAFVRTPRVHRMRLCVFGAIPAVVLVGTPLVTQWSSTSKVLFRQPNFPYLDHATPWVALSPHLSRASVGAGPGRLLAILGAVALAGMASRCRPSRVGFLWLCALALCLRCVFEAVMVPFYLGPPLAVILLAASLRSSWPRLIGASTVAIVATVVAFHRLPDWSYWAPMVLLLALGLGLGWPGLRALGLSPRRPAGLAAVDDLDVDGDRLVDDIGPWPDVPLGRGFFRPLSRNVLTCVCGSSRLRAARRCACARAMPPGSSPARPVHQPPPSGC